jgi:hypothetical protein
MKNSLRFILLDDDLCALAITAQIIRNYDRRAGIISFSACNEAIRYLEAGHFIDKDKDTVLLTDLHMPEFLLPPRHRIS